MTNITFSDKQLFMHVFLESFVFFLLRPAIPGLAPFSMEGHQESLKSAKGLKLGTNQGNMK